MTDSAYPSLTEEAIEAAAVKLLAEFTASTGEQINAPIPVERIAERFLGYRIDITDQGLFADPDYLGGVDFDSKTILVNSSVEGHEGRYAFTIAHELGHHVLHREHYQQQKQGSQAQIMCRSKGKRPMIEYQADRFAAALLMPAVPLTIAARALKAKSLGPRRLQRLATLLIAEGGFSNVSHEAMRYRLLELKLGGNPLAVPRLLYVPSVWVYRLLRRWLRG